VEPYAITVLPAARRELKSLERAALVLIDAAITALAADPRPSGCKKLRGDAALYRVKVNTIHGPYRVLYAIDDRTRVVEIARVAHRREVY